MRPRSPFDTFERRRRLARDPWAKQSLRHKLAREQPGIDPSRIEDLETAERFAPHIFFPGHTRFARPTSTGAATAAAGGGATAVAAAAEPAPAPAAEPATSWVGIELLDEEGNAVAGAKYRIDLPDGSTAEGTLDTSGRVRVEDVVSGTCKITFPDLSSHQPA